MTFRQSGPSSAARSFSSDFKYRFRCPDSPPSQTGISFVFSLMCRTFPQRGDGLSLTVNAALHSGSRSHTNPHGFWFLLIQCRAKQPSVTGTMRLTERRDQKALLYQPLIYPKEVHNTCEHWDLEQTRPGKALTEGSQSLRSDNHGRNSPQRTPKNGKLTNSARISKTLWSK